MGKGDEISDAEREESARQSHLGIHRHRGPLQRYIDRKLDTAINMLGRFSDRPSWAEDPLEETLEEEMKELEKTRQAVEQSERREMKEGDAV